MITATIVVGNPRARSRTRTVAEKLVTRLLSSGAANVTVIDLAEYAPRLFDWPSEELAEISARVAASDLVVFASPTYKATYTGLMKAFLDRYPANGLAGVVALPVLTGADARHSMAPIFTLAPLLTELGASVPGRGLYFVVSQMDQIDAVIEKAAAEYLAQLGRLAALSAALPSTRLLSASS